MKTITQWQMLSVMLARYKTPFAGVGGLQAIYAQGLNERFKEGAANDV